MYANGNAIRIRVNRGLVAGIFVGLIIAASFAFLTAHQDRLTFSSLTPNTLGGNNPAASGRDPLLWPFSRDSIWNLPIGSNARYVCAGQSPTSHYMFGSEDLYGTGETGSHGGSGLSALGGTVRLGELVPGGTIRHSLKLNIDSANFYPGLGGYRWPAWKSDAGGAGYGGSIPEVRMGSLLAPKPDFPIDTFETEPGKIVAAAFRDYGGYIVDTSGWSIYNFVTERSPAGSVQDEFNKAWGYPLNAGVGANGWARDLDKIFTNLYVVDNWDKATWQTVSVSNGNVGVGLGTPRVGWAPEFGQVPPPPPPPPPPPTPPPPGLTGTTVMLTTSKSPSETNETVTVSGRLTDASGSPVAGGVLALVWAADQTTWASETQLGQVP